MSQSTGSGFIINSLELNGFMRYDVATLIPFIEKFTVITGPTGSGKTSILDSITYALYGRSSRTDEKMKVEEFVSDDGYVQLDFSQDGQPYQVIRGRKRGKTYLLLNRGTQRISGTTSELEERIKNLVGLDYTGFVNSTFIRQDEMKRLGSETGSERLDIFERLFRLEIFEHAQDLADSRLRLTENDMAAAKQELLEKKKDFEEILPREREKLEGAVKNHDRVRKDIEEFRSKLGGCKEAVARLEPIHKEFEKAASKISDLKDEIKEATFDLEEAKKKNARRSDLKKEFSKLKGAPEKERELMQAIAKLENLQSNVSKLQYKKGIHEEQLSKIETQTKGDLSDMRSQEKMQRDRLQQFAKELTKDEAFDQIRLDGALRERLARIPKEIKWLKDFSPDIVKSLKLENKKTSMELSKTESKVKRIGADPFVKGEIEDNLNGMRDQIKSITARSKQRIDNEQKELESLELELKKIHFDKSDSNKLEDLRGELESVRNAAEEYNSLSQKLDALPDQDSLIESLERSISKKEEERAEVSEKEKSLRTEEKEYQDKKGELEKLRNKEPELQEALGAATKEMELLEKRVQELEGLAPRIGQLERELKEYNLRREVYTILKQEIFHRKGILVFAIKQLLQGISIEASQILGDLTDQRLNNIRITPTTETKGGSVLIEVEGVDGLFHDVSTFSGGEKTQINASLRFAIAKELSGMPQVGTSYGNMKTLFIDEGDLGSLDNENARIYFVKKLLRLGESFERIILITHITEVAERFPNRIRVYMTPEQNSRVELRGNAA